MAYAPLSANDATHNNILVVVHPSTLDRKQNPIQIFKSASGEVTNTKQMFQVSSFKFHSNYNIIIYAEANKFSLYQEPKLNNIVVYYD